MARPDSVLTKMRRKLVDIIEPMPDEGEGWCIGCSLNHGKSVIFPADGVEQHIVRHETDEVLHLAVSKPPMITI